MKRSYCVLLSVLATGAFLVAVPPAEAVDIINSDKAAHDLVVVESGEPMRFRIAPRATLTDVCSACRIQVGSKETTDAEDGDTVTIRDGRPEVGG